MRAPSHTWPACKCWTSAQETPTSPLQKTWRRMIKGWKKSRKHKTRSFTLTLDCIESWTERAVKWEWTCECHFPGPWMFCLQWISFTFLVQDTGCLFSFHFFGLVSVAYLHICANICFWLLMCDIYHLIVFLCFVLKKAFNVNFPVRMFENQN